MDWHALEDEIIGRLDVQAEYAKLGVEFTGKIRQSGYIECKAYGRQDAVASACVNVDTGHYKDSGAGDKEITLWQFAADTGRFPTWQMARQFYATEVGVVMPGQNGNVVVADPHCTLCNQPGHWRNACPQIADRKPREGNATLFFVPDPEAKDPGDTHRYRSIVGNWIRLYKKCQIINIDGCYKAGCQIGQKVLQETGKAVEPVIGWRTFNLDDEGNLKETGHVLVNRGSDRIKVRAGDDDSSYAKCQSIGSCGLVGAQAVHALISDKKPIILLCEGLSDLLAASSVIPKIWELQPDDPLPVSNKNGASETANPYFKILAKASEVWIVRDADKAGVKSGEEWAYALTKEGIPCRNVKLPFKVTPKHGQDLRDYLADHSWDDLKKLCKETPLYIAARKPAGLDDNPYVAGPPPEPPPIVDPNAEGILERCGVHVLGHYRDEKTVIFEAYSDVGQWIVRHATNSFSYNDAITCFGPQIEWFVAEKAVEGDIRPTFKSFMREVSKAAGKRHLTNDCRIGTGVWMEGGKIVLVNGNEAYTLSDDMQLEQLRVPVVGDKIITLTGNQDIWFEPKDLQAALNEVKNNGELRQSIMDQVDELFDAWTFRNETPKHLWQLRRLYVGCMGAMLVQQLWIWRPIVTITGDTRAGKTALLEHTQMMLTATNFIINNKNDTYQFGNSRKIEQPSAAGLRQKLNDSAYCCFLDEIEKSKYRQELFELLRSCSSGSTTVRGTAHHKVQTWRLKLLPFCAGIESGVNMIADDNRRIKFDIVKPPTSATKAFENQWSDTNKIVNLSNHFRALLLFKLRRALHLEGELRTTVCDLDKRRKDTYAGPIAMYAALRDWTSDQAESMMKDLITLVDKDTDSDLRSDEIRLVQTILDKQLRESHGKIVTLRALWNLMKNPSKPYVPNKDEEEMMDRHGWRVTNKWNVAIVPPRIMSVVLADTPFDGTRIREILQRVSPSVKYNMTRLYDGSTVKGIIIPINVFRKLADPDEVSEDLPFQEVAAE